MPDLGAVRRYLGPFHLRRVRGLHATTTAMFAPDGRWSAAHALEQHRPRQRESGKRFDLRHRRMGPSQNGRLLGGLDQQQNDPVVAVPGAGDAHSGRQGSGADRVAGAANDQRQRRVRLGLRLLQIPDENASVRDGEHHLERQKRPIGSQWYVDFT